MSYTFSVVYFGIYRLSEIAHIHIYDILDTLLLLLFCTMDTVCSPFYMIVIHNKTLTENFRSFFVMEQSNPYHYRIVLSALAFH